MDYSDVLIPWLDYTCFITCIHYFPYKNLWCWKNSFVENAIKAIFPISNPFLGLIFSGVKLCIQVISSFCRLTGFHGDVFFSNFLFNVVDNKDHSVCLE